MITDFLTANPQIDLQTADLFSANALAQYNWPEDVHQQELLQSLRTRQRLLKINPDDKVAAVLESLGFHSAHHIAATGKSAFTQKVMPALSQLSNIESPRAFCTQLFGNAERIRRASFELALGVPQTVAAKVAEPLGEEINAIFQQGIPDYQRLFGPMFTCDCKDCQSIFGPAAYFTDLMRVVSQYVSPPPETLFSLRYRRPDLWTMPLDCRSSDSEIAYLDIVNEVICQHLKVNYLHNADPMQQMAARVYPFSTPFNSSLYTIRGGLEALGTSLSSIYRLLEAPALAASAEALSLSPEQLSLVTGSYQASLTQLYGFHDETLSDEAVCEALTDQKVFLQKTGLSPDQLEELIYQQLKKGSGSYVMQDKGSQDAKTVAFPDAVLAGSITIECWVYPTSTYTNMSIIGKGKGEEFYFYLANKNIRCKYGDADGFSSVAELNLHAWTHIAWTRNGNENTIYINGVPDSTHPVSGTIQINNSSIGIGYISGASSFHGGITELRIWSEARSADLIRKMMYLRLQNYTDAHLFAYWPLNEQTGKTAYDFGPYHYDATGGYETAFYEGVPIGSTSELNPTILHGLFLNNLLPSGQFIGIAKPTVSQDNPLLNLFADPKVVGLSDQVLRQIAVYIRLQAQTGWSFGELDWLLKTVVNSLNIPTQSTINEAIIESLGQVAGLVKKYKIPIDELSSFWSEMKTYGRGNETDSQALWDRVFNRPPLMANSTDPDQPTYYRPTYTLNPLFTSPVIHWAYLDAVGSQDDRLANQLAAALKISIQDLYAIIQSTIKTDVTRSPVALSVSLLSRFYRIARFAEMLDLSVPDFIQLSLIAGSAISDTKFTWKISEVIRLIEIAEWMQAMCLTMKQLSYLTSIAAPDLSLQLLDVSAISKALDYMMQSSKQVLLSSGSFVNDRVDAAAAEGIYTQLVQAEIIDSDGVVLQDDPKLPQELIDFLPSEGDQQDVLQVLQETFTAQNHLVVKAIASLAAVSVDTMAGICFLTSREVNNASMFSNPSSEPYPYFVNLLLNTGSQAPDILNNYLSVLQRNTAMARWLKLTGQEVSAMLNYSQLIGGQSISYGTQFLSLQQLITLTDYKSLQNRCNKVNGLLDYFRQANDPGANTPSSDQLALLSQMTGWNLTELESIVNQPYFAAINFNTVGGLRKLANVVTLEQKIGTDISTLNLLRGLSVQNLFVGTNDQYWQQYTDSAVTTLAMLEGKLGASAVETLKIRDATQVRTVLCDWLIWELQRGINRLKSQQDLYEYLLIDVSMSPDVKISWMVTAMNSLQLYVNRIINNLEPGTENKIPEIWWEWMSNYRVWQTNREIYLYPENYVDPALRKFQSPAFKTFISDVSKGQITDENVKQSLTNYLETINEVASLELVDGYVAAFSLALAGELEDDEKKAIHLIGRSRKKPFVFYSRTALAVTSTAALDRKAPFEDATYMHFGPWQEINLQINADYVSTVVAFGRQFIFWVEQTEIIDTDNNSNKYTSVYAAIYYSYRNFSGKWEAPILFVKDILVDVFGPAIGIDTINYYEDYFVGARLGNSQTEDKFYKARNWKEVKVQVLPSTDTESEKILVTYGPLVCCPSSMEKNPPKEDTSEMIPAAADYQNMLRLAAKRAYIRKGNVTTILEVHTLNNTMEVDTWKLSINQSNVFFIDYATLPLDDETSLVFFADTLGNDAEIDNPYKVPDAFWPMLMNMNLVEDTTIKSLYTDAPGTFSKSPTVLTGTNSLYNTLKPVFFDGELYATIPWDKYQSLTKFTVSCWVYLQTPTTNQNLLSFIFPSNSTSKCGWDISIKDSKFQFGIGIQNGISTQIKYGNANERKWYFVALTVNSESKIVVTVDISSSSAYTIPYSPVSSSPQLTIGKNNGNNNSYSQLSGSIANLKVWENPLSTEELLDEYQSSGMAPSQEQMLRLGNSAAGFIYNVRKQSYLALPCFESALLSECLMPNYYMSNRHLNIYFSQSPVNEYQEAKMKLIRVNTDTLPTLIHILAKGGVNTLLRPAMQYLPEEKPPVVAGANLLLPETDLMNFSGAFGAYFWEIFFYAPYYVAEKLRTANKYPAAEKWYQYIFDPTNQATPVAYWPLNRTFNDQFPNLTGREAAIPNGPTASSEETPFFSNKPREIWKLDPKNNSYFSVPYAKALNSPEFTVAAWINLASVPANSQAYSVVCSQSENKGFHLAIWGTGNEQWSLILTMGTSDSKWINAISPLYVGTGQWIHVTGTYDGKSLQVFINGIALTVEEVICENYIVNTARLLTIGSGNSVDANSNFFDGSIAEVMLFDHALSQGELLQIYQDYPQLSLNSNFWNFRPFRRINAQSLYHILNGDAWQESFFQPAQYYTASLQMAVYEYDPFDPDTLARLRVNSWQKATFMRYMDNLISWGDSLFTQNTWETISDATMRYTLATTLLGRMPVKEVTEETKPTVNYNSMELEYGEGKVPPFLIEVENQLSGLGADATLPEQIQSIVDAYYCIPSNKQLLKYWELVVDRLYKIRHGLSISGAQNAIPLYASPINPAAAASLVAKGDTINTMASSTSPVVPWYRFNYMMAQARSVTAEVARLGSELLVALEKKDAEKLSQLQAGYQLVLNNLSGQIKASQINQLQYLGEGLQANLDNAKYVQDTYKRWLKTSINFEEAVALDQLANAEILQEVGVALKGAATISLLLPNIFGLANGGFNPGESFNASASVFDTGAQIAQTRSQQTSQTAQFNRREEEWEMQLNISSNQIREIEAQIAANDFSLQAAQREMVLTATQWQQSQEVYQFLQTKFTNEELYDWMSGQLSTLYFQMFQLAWSLAQSAQTALQYELNLNQTYLNQTAWNAGYQGLLAGDALSLALQQMENAYISGNNRKLEIRKIWSMRQNNPRALLVLVSTGNCHFDLNELNYDLDFPGHYNRKIKSLSITIPAVVGPYQSIHATLTQMGNTVIVKPNIAAVEYLLGLPDKAAPTDGSLRVNWNPNQEIIISSGINDAGVFQLNFNDEQYLPFEGTGAISSWNLRIPQASNAFSLRSISDVIITVEYTAEDGGSTYASKVTALAPLTDYKGWQYLSLRQLYSTAWFDFCEHPVDDVYALAFELLAQMYPANLDKGSVKLGNDEGEIGLVPVMQQGYTGDLPTFKLNNAIKSWTADDGMLPISGDDPLVPQLVPGKGNPWTLYAEGVSETLLINGKIDQTKLLDIILLIPFNGKLSW
ncbi:Tc toxin subunit A-related protein [Olivibacter domesticus]|nr:LamG-like jellyroll fold domain-containing protein [Olivibacter domesticus]